MRARLLFSLGMLVGLVGKLFAAAPAGAEALLILMGDQHSAYERTAQVVAQIDRLRAADPALPMAILVDGDVFEYGNVVARRSAGALDFAMLAAFARRAPTIVNLGNHEPEFHDLAETVALLRATGVTVVSNINDRNTGKPAAPASTRLKLGKHDAVVVGLSTDLLASFRVALRPALDLADPVVWGRKNFPELLTQAPVKIVMSHAGLAADRNLLPLVPDGTFFAGAHDHARFVHRVGRTAYAQSGSWNESLTLAYLVARPAGETRWEIRQEPVDAAAPGDPALAALIRETEAKHLTAEDRVIVGRSPRAMSPDEAARFAVRATREAAAADAAFVGRTTFGAGLPAGGVSQVAFDAWARFDNAICVAEVTGTQLAAIMAIANENEDTPFARRRGDYLVGDGPEKIEPARTYRLATTDWIARDPARYFEQTGIVLKEVPGLRFKPVVAAALAAGKKNEAAPAR